MRSVSFGKAMMLVHVALVFAGPAGAQAQDTTSRTATRSATHAAARRALDDYYDRVARTAGLVPLGQAVLPAGAREIRIWLGGGFVAPSWMYRFVSQSGRVSGDIVFYWPSYGAATTSTDSVVRNGLGKSCVDFTHRENVSTCRAHFTRRPPWKVVLDSIEALGVWSLPDPATFPPDRVVMTDGWGADFELRKGKSFRSVSYNNPGAHPAWPSARQVIDIAREIRTLDSLAIPGWPHLDTSADRR